MPEYYSLDMVNNQMPEKIKSYLKKFSSRRWKVELSNLGKYDIITVIPAIDELDNIPVLLESFGNCKIPYNIRILLLFIINNSHDSPQNVKRNNKESLDYLRANVVQFPIDIGLIDASTEGNELPDKHAGVGLARKIGMDLALGLFDFSLGKKQMILCLDADCTVSRNYFTESIKKYEKCPLFAGYFNFEHPIPEEKSEAQAIISYEIFLRYYVLGLKIANSPYAFYTVGSTIAVDAESYVKAGGMNKKKAGEDFYFMEKLAKVTKISKINGATVFPSPRSSWRVPFGTGQRVGRFLKGTRNEYFLHSFNSFLDLKKFLSLYMSNIPHSPDELLRQSKEINKWIYQFLNDIKFKRPYSKILENSKTEEQLNKQKSILFDGFMTMKLIHFLRDNCYPDEPMFPTLKKMFDYLRIKNPEYIHDNIPPTNIQLSYLLKLRDIKDEFI